MGYGCGQSALFFTTRTPSRWVAYSLRASVLLSVVRSREKQRLFHLLHRSSLLTFNLACCDCFWMKGLYSCVNVDLFFSGLMSFYEFNSNKCKRCTAMSKIWSCLGRLRWNSAGWLIRHNRCLFSKRKTHKIYTRPFQHRFHMLPMQYQMDLFTCSRGSNYKYKTYLIIGIIWVIQTSYHN